MAITTYAELKTAIATWLERTDFTSRIPEFLALAQAKMYRGERSLDGKGWIRKPLRVRAMLATNQTLTPTAGVADLTTLTRFLEMKRVFSNQATPIPIEMMSPEQFWTMEGAYLSGEPKFGTIEGDTLYLAKKDSTALKVAYYQRFAALSGDSDTDWVLTNAPHVYLHGALAEAYTFEGADDLCDRHTSLFNGAVNALDASEEDAALSGSVLVMRPATVA